MSEWTALIDLDELATGSLKARRVGPRRIVLARTLEGAVYALDNRCPHEGYPLATGTLRGCDLTCTWHNWKFDVRDGACRIGGEGVRSYPVRVREGRVEVDLAEPDPEQFFPGWLASLHEGLQRHENGRAIRDCVRLLHAGYDPWALLAEVARHDADHAEYGTTHALPVAADCGRFLQIYGGVRAAYALAPAIDMCGDANRLRPLRERPAPLAGADEASLRRAIEEEDAQRAEGLLLGAFEAGVPRETIESWLYAALSDHFLSFGHPLIYLVKAQELFEGAGEQHAPAILGSLVFRIVHGTREDTLPYMHPYREEWQRLPTDIAGGAGRPFDGEALRAAVLDAERGEEAMTELAHCLRAGADPEAVAAELVLAAAERLLRFDPEIEQREDVAESWLWATHRFTFAAAVHQALRRWSHPRAAALLGQVVMFVHSGRAMDLAPECRISLEAEAGDPLEAVLSHDPKRAVRRALHPDLDLEASLEGLGEILFADNLVRPIVVAHGIKTACAGLEESTALGEHPLARLPLAAALRLCASPIRERALHQTVTTSIAWIVDGRVPTKLTQ